MSHWDLYHAGKITLKEAQHLQGLKLSKQLAEYHRLEKKYAKRRKKSK